MSNIDKLVIWPEWETVRLIGRGSFGSVYEIQRAIFDEVETAALKVISIPQNDSDIDEMYSEGYDDESITSTFQSHLKSITAEYSLMRKMNGSANVVNCDDIRIIPHEGSIGWDIYIKMELLTPLAKALPDNVPEETVIQIAKDMCAALELCKKHEIVHRDIKPQNIFISPNGDYKLGDFGIAKTVEKTMGGTKIGTYKFMAPEVYNNQPYGHSADLYSLGLVLYWLLNERRMPFMPLPPAKMLAGMDEEARRRRFAGEALPAPLNGSEELKKIVLKACAFDPRDRYGSAEEMRKALNLLSTNEKKAPIIHQGIPCFRGEIVPPTEDAVPETALPSADTFHEYAESVTAGHSADTVRYCCSNCGNVTNNPGKYCGFCGGEMEMQLPANSLTDRDTKETTEPIKPRKKKVFLVLAICVVAIVAVFFILWGLLGHFKGNAKDSIRSISLKSGPDKTAYYVGETLDTSGLILTVTYNDGSHREISDGFSCTPNTFSEAGIHHVTVRYEGKQTTFQVDVQPILVSGIAIKSGPDKTAYYVGETLDTSGLILTVTYNDGSQKDITDGFTCTPNTFGDEGVHRVTVSYEGENTHFVVNVTKVSVSSIALKSKPDKTTYSVGESLDTTGLELTVNYDDGSKKTITKGFSCSPASFVTTGAHNITVSYADRKVVFTVNVIGVTAQKITITTKPSRTTYYLGEELDTSGLRLTVVYSDGGQKTVSTGFTCSPGSFSRTGTQTVTVRYEGCETTFTVEVKDVEVSSIEITLQPHKDTYYVGETLDTSGLVLAVIYSDGRRYTMTSGFTCSPTTFNASGRYTITVSYGGLYDFFEVFVLESGDLSWE